MRVEKRKFIIVSSRRTGFGKHFSVVICATNLTNDEEIRGKTAEVNNLLIQKYPFYFERSSAHENLFPDSPVENKYMRSKRMYLDVE